MFLRLLKNTADITSDIQKIIKNKDNLAEAKNKESQLRKGTVDHKIVDDIVVTKERKRKI